MADLEKEVGRLRATERSLRDAVCNKLLLEEQVHQLQSRVDALQPVQQELHEAKVLYFTYIILGKRKAILFIAIGSTLFSLSYKENIGVIQGDFF